jgi:UDP-sugar diphosphatase
MLQEIIIKSIQPNKKPQYLKTKIVKIQRGQKTFTWEVLNQKDSVHIFIDNIETKEIILVKQKRVPVLINDDRNNGEVIELCAGLIDKKGKSITKIAIEEVEEEVGYEITKKDIKLIKKFKSAVGSSGSNSFLFFAKVNESMKISDGGGLEDEDIEVLRIKYDDINSFINNEDIDTDVITSFAIQHWSINNILEKIQKNKGK